MSVRDGKELVVLRGSHELCFSTTPALLCLGAKVGRGAGG